jgi:hypothetical protein
MRSRTDSVLLFLTALAAGAFLGARDPGELVRASLLSGFELESRGCCAIPGSSRPGSPRSRPDVCSSS